MKIKTTLTLIAFAATTLLLSFQPKQNGGDEFILKITAQLNKYLNQAPQEKVYLHLDKPYYMAGETIWFKGYLFDAVGHNIDSVSRVLYVDLVNNNTQTVIQHQTLACENGTSHGDFLIDSTLTEGVYTVQAYTQFMRNYSDEYFFKKDIKILKNAINSAVNEGEMAELATIAECTFFPEGGHLVQNIDSRVGFKAVNKWGRGIDVSGYIVDDNQDSVTFFKSEHLGMGVFNFIPQPNRKYFAKIKNPNGNLLTVPLPEAQQKGYVMQIDNISGKNDIKIYISSSHPQTTGDVEEIVLIGHQRGQICFTARTPNKKNRIPISIPRKNIPDDGIVNVTLFNGNGEPVCERLIFVKQPEAQVNIKLITDKSIYKPREKITLTVKATEPNGAPIKGNFSLSATDSKQVITPQYESNILTYMLLSSDLKGYIEDPAYYFKPNDFLANRHLDFLMMTQGWRRFVWKDIQEERYPPFQFLVESGLSITGKAIKFNKKAYPNAQMTLFLKESISKTPQLSISSCDSLGRFGFYNLHFQDTCNVLVQATKKKGSRDLDILLDNVTIPTVSRPFYPFYPISFDAATFALFLKTTAETLEFERKLKFQKEQMLQTVEIKAQKKTRLDSRRIYNALSGRSINITDEDCVSYRNAFSIIEMKVPGIKVIFNGQEYEVSSRNQLMSFAIDGIITDNAFIDVIQPCEIETIDVLRGSEASIFGGSVSPGGVINILTKFGNPDYKGPQRPTQGIVTTNRVGYKIAREFYAPQYNDYKPEHDLPDFRSTLFWTPSVKTNENGEATISFWCSDAKNKIKINVEGFSHTGRLGIGYTEIDVQ